MTDNVIDASHRFRPYEFLEFSETADVLYQQIVSARCDILEDLMEEALGGTFIRADIPCYVMRLHQVGFLTNAQANRILREYGFNLTVDTTTRNY